MRATPAIKFGVPSEAGELADAVVYCDCWMRETTSTGTDRLVIAPKGRHVDLIIKLLNRMQGPFGILYVLVVPRGDHEKGRYQSKSPCDKQKLVEFLSDFRDYFEQDGRHHVWVSGLGDRSQLVYDNHNVILAYGPLEAFEGVLANVGFRKGQVSTPGPHIHFYNEQFDEDERRIFNEYQWKWFPLQELDEP
jgi:hypothetical protein